MVAGVKVELERAERLMLTRVVYCHMGGRSSHKECVPAEFLAKTVKNHDGAGIGWSRSSARRYHRGVARPSIPEIGCASGTTQVELRGRGR